ncbi:MAG: Wzz/FepE/Etk N-terminal domain-containing protein, partial [Candidatus Angelobacter sp.]
MKTSSKQQEQGLHQQAQIYLQLLRRSIWTIGFWTLLLTAAAAVAIIFLPDQYKATTTILVDPQQIPDRYVASTVTSDP